MSDAEPYILDRLGQGLTDALKSDSPLNLHVGHAANHGFYGFTIYRDGPQAGQMVDDWFAFAGHIGRALYKIKPYRFMDLGCNVGGKMGFFTSWGCEKYLGVDQMNEGIVWANARFANQVVSFATLDVVTQDWPTGFTALGMTYVFQHVGITAKRTILRKVREYNPAVFILIDRCLRDGTLTDCEKEHAGSWTGSKQVPFPASELVASLPNHTMLRPAENLFIFERKP